MCTMCDRENSSSIVRLHAVPKTLGILSHSARLTQSAHAATHPRAALPSADEAGSLELGQSCRIAAACRQGTARLVRDRGCPWRARTGNFRAFKNSTRSKIRNSARSDIRTGRISACHIGRLGVARCSAPSKFKIQTLHAG